MLSQVQELVVHRQPDLLDTFYEEVVAFQSDKNSDVRKWVVGFIEEACKKDGRMLPLLLPNVQLLLEDGTVSVVKRCVQATAPLHKCTLVWVTSAHTITSDMELAWIILTGIKSKVTAMIDHENDGVRTQVIKCMESMILVQSYSETTSVHRERENVPFCLDRVPLTLKLTRPRKLEDEAKQMVQKLVSFLGSIHISSVNLMTCMSSLVILARARPIFLPSVVQSLELLHANLPPTLSKSQVNSVRKHLKLQLINLLKHPSACDFHDNIITVLTDLGMSSSEINKAVPNREEIRRQAKKRERAKAAAVAKKEDGNEGSARKRARLSNSTLTSNKDIPEDHKNTIKSKNTSQDTPSTLASLTKIKTETIDSKKIEDEGGEDDEKEETAGTLLDMTTKWVLRRLTIDNVTELVMTSMLSLPPTMPGLFSAGYTPVSGAGTLQQKQQLSRLLASQLVAANVSPMGQLPPQTSVAPMAEGLTEEDIQRLGDSDDEGPFVSFLGSRPPNLSAPPPALPAPILAPIRHKIQAVKLSEVTPVLSEQQQRSLSICLVRNLLRSYHFNNLSQLDKKHRMHMIAKLLAFSSADEIRGVEDTMLQDPSKYCDLIELWIFCVHSATCDFSQLARITGRSHKKKVLTSKQEYDDMLVRVVRSIVPQCTEQTYRDLLSRLLLSCPAVPVTVVSALVECAVSDNNNSSALVCYSAPLLRDLALWRSNVATHTLALLCSLAMHSDDQVRKAILQEAEAILLIGGSQAESIMSAGRRQLLYLEQPEPPDAMFAEFLGRPTKLEEWDEATVKACLDLPLTILPLHEALVHDLALVYIKTVNEAKRGILRLLEGPVSLMGMDSPQLLALVRSTPKGSETLITRIIHILTEKAPPSEALVCQVRELYNRRVSDVRFLIPVLTGLSKKEIIAVLHKLIKLNPHVVKEVFNRLWGVALDSGTSPLSPVELLVALHLIEADKCDVKTVIKATGLCFQERSIYTAEVLAEVLQQLLDEPVIPTLFMRTVIMTLTHHPQLLSLIISVLLKLIEKKVWEQPKIWEGFVKCCERASPQCVAVLLQLPIQQLSDAFEASSMLKNTLATHIKSLTKHQKSSIGLDVLALVGALDETPDDQDRAAATTAPVREIPAPLQLA
ncbi:symplekin [Hyalella azteca]|uniref:Symplekin n=1 Tax=Hyalella azteca TaxID=294128 RepID=A0A8B7NZ82_HYAAZ|nr:symplekin [Hyalella azteca]